MHLGGSVEHLTLGLGSGHDLTVHGFEPSIRLCARSVVPAWDSLSSSGPPPLMLVLSIKSKLNKKKKKNGYYQKEKKE